MKTIGMIGGMSWESTTEYYRILNQLVSKKLGAAHSCPLILYSVDFEPIKQMQHREEWDKISLQIVELARKLESGGASLIMVCANTMHLLADDIKKSISIPFIHIVDATAKAIKQQEIEKVGLLGTRFTMEYPFFREKLEQDYGIRAVTPDIMERETIHEIIYNELIKGIVKPSSAEKFRSIIRNLQSKGAEGIILGCTEFSMIIKKEEYSIPLFDTTYLHAVDAVDQALQLR